MNKDPILIVAAMEVEFDLLKSKLDNLKISKINKYTFFEGTINNYPVVICNSLIMSINATIATTIAIEKYHPIIIINEGTAGGHSLNIHKGDIVIGKKCVNILSSETSPKKQGEGSNSLEWRLTNFISGEENRLIYEEANLELVNLAKSIEYKDGNVHVGTVGSADIWDREYDRIKMLNERYNTICEDMEAIGIYTVSNQFDIPVVAIKVISNNERLGERFDKNTEKKAQEFCYKLMEKIIKEIEK